MSKRPRPGARGARQRRDQPSPRETPQQRYRARLRAIAPLVTFRSPLTPSPYQRRKVYSYFRYLFGDQHAPGITSGVRARVSIRSKKKRARAQRELGYVKTELRYVWPQTVIDARSGEPAPVDVVVPTSLHEPVRFVAANGVEVIRADFDATRLAQDPVSEVKRVCAWLLQFLPKGAAYHFAINNGDWTMPGGALVDRLIGEVRSYMRNYAAGTGRTSNDPSRDWSRWMFGVTMRIARRQDSLSKAVAARADQISAVKELLRFPEVTLRIMHTLDTKLPGGGPVEIIARLYAGDKTDQATRTALSVAARRGWVNGDDNRFMLTRAGRSELRAWRAVLARLGRQP